MSMETVIQHICQKGKGILAADESNATMGKRLAQINTDNTEENRRQFRSLLATTPKLGKYISAVILYKETFHQNADSEDRDSISRTFESKEGILTGIKVDEGLMNLEGTTAEKVTQGIDTLSGTLKTYKTMGASFAKWRATYQVDDHLPSSYACHVNATLLARYARICQTHDIVPIVEPEVLMDGMHSIARCAEVTEAVLTGVFSELKKHAVILENIILKPNMVISGKNCNNQADSQTIANTTLSVFKRAVPAAVPTINFLSGGQSETAATENLKAMNAMGTQPWHLRFSYGRALQAETLKIWQGQKENISAAQAALLKVARANSEATL